MDLFNLPDIELSTVVSQMTQLMIAFLLALPIAWDREIEERTLGLRTFPLVAMASAGYILMTQAVLDNGSEEIARVIAGLMTGIGFLGGGAILKRGDAVRGTATAASIWSTAAVGAAVAFARYEIAIALTLVNFLTLRYLKRVKRLVEDGAAEIRAAANGDD